MTYLVNSPRSFADEAIDGLCDAFPDVVRRIPGGVMRSTRRQAGKVAVVVGGGAGHYPAFGGMVGYGLADAAVCGDIFSSPSAQQAHAVCRAVDQGAGTLLVFGNYQGDVLNFGAASLTLRDLGYDMRCLVVTDDVASDPVPAGRRGIAGDLVVFKIAGAAAEEGYDLDATERVAQRANDRLRSFGVAFDGCALPGAGRPLFSVPHERVALGLGIHGEPGIGELPLPTAEALASELVTRLLDDRPVTGPARVAALLNGLGAVKYEELFVLWRSVSRLLRDAGLEVVVADVGEFVTSLDMAGCSLSLTWLDDELERLWLAPAHATGFRRGNVPALAPDLSPVPEISPPVPRAAASEDGKRAGRLIAELVGVVNATLHEHRVELGDLDAVAGDGDHGLGMTRGSNAAMAAAADAANLGAGARAVLRAAADAWSARAGGTSGIIWGVGLNAVARALPADGSIRSGDVKDGLCEALHQIMSLGDASPGDKTLVDALHPFVEAFVCRLDEGDDLAQAWGDAARRAMAGAQATLDIPARLGRSRVLGDRSVGTPDPGAVSLALCLEALSAWISSTSTREKEARHGATTARGDRM